MAMLRRSLPPLNAVRVFEVTARTAGIRAAASVLNISQSAISRHISNLEQHLQTQLFTRVGRRIELTDAGREYLQQLEPALDLISRASTRAASITHRKKLNLSSPPSFLASWILPRLASFLSENPEIELRFVDRMTHPEHALDVDCAIEYRTDPSPRLVSEVLLSDEIVPMAAPSYIHARRIGQLDDLRRCTLIETERRLVSWLDVLDEKTWVREPRMITVSLSLHALEAARLGYGVALANRHNALKLIQSADLAIPFSIDQSTLPPRPKYYFSYLKTVEKYELSLRFRNWLKLELQRSLNT